MKSTIPMLCMISITFSSLNAMHRALVMNPHVKKAAVVQLACDNEAQGSFVDLRSFNKDKHRARILNDKLSKSRGFRSNFKGLGSPKRNSPSQEAYKNQI